MRNPIKVSEIHPNSVLIEYPEGDEKVSLKDLSNDERTDMQDIEIEKWIKRHSRNKFGLYKIKIMSDDHCYRRSCDKGSKLYYLMWYDRNKNKFKYGYVYDGMRTRYGIETIATLTEPSVTGFWGIIQSEDIFNDFIKFAKSELDLEPFDLHSLKNLRV